jgi:superfamily II DNA or RNA helicase
LVRVRGQIWQVQGVRPFGACTAFNLEQIGGPGPARRLTLFSPFDRPEPIRRAGSFAVVSRRRWNRKMAALFARSCPADRLLAPATANLDLLPFQFEPALAMALDGVPRVLIADAVGLGKTIQAGLVILELRLRRLADRVLILTPAGLRHQWARELRRRFRLACAVLDAPALADLHARLPSTVNPWSVSPLVIASLDFVKRPDVERGAADVPWDLVVVDEAHLAAPGTLRREAVRRLTSASPHVVLLTATPHAGDDAAFAALSALGGVSFARTRSRTPGDRASPRPSSDANSMVVFRRTRADVGLARTRRVHLQAVTLSPAERRMHTSLLALARAIWGARAGSGQSAARLAVTVLLKRALSSPASLVRSLEHRIGVLTRQPSPGPAQPGLFEEDEPADNVDPSNIEAPGLRDRVQEVEWLRRIRDEARLAAAAPAKRAALARMLTRIREPAIVFTEYRDTALELADRIGASIPCTVLHGGLDEHARAGALRQFARGRARVLVATDAAGEGLNLQARCRLVINLELPWNPMRLEQRIGRVDRIGQSRIVHAVHLVARDTLESRVLARLARRLERVRLVLGGIDDPLGPASDTVVAGALLTGSGIERLWAPREWPALDAARVSCSLPGLDARARAASACAAEQRTLVACRALRPTLHRTRRRTTQSCPVLLLRGPSARRSWPGRFFAGHSGLLLVFEAWVVRLHGEFIESVVVPIWVPCPIARLTHPRDTLAEVRRVVDALTPHLQEHARQQASERAGTLEALLGPGTRRRRARMAAVAWAKALESQRPVQQGLFERRAERDTRGGPRPESSEAQAMALAIAPPRGSDPGEFRLAGEPLLVSVLAVLARAAQR